MTVNSIAKSPIFDVPGVYGYIMLSSAFGYSADILPC